MNSRNLLCDSPTGHNLESFNKISAWKSVNAAVKAAADKAAAAKAAADKAAAKAAAEMSRIIDAKMAALKPGMIYKTESYNNPQVEECYENARDHLNYNTISSTWKPQKKYTL
jgi:hypothetical protein